MVNVHFITLGCPKNESDTAAMQARIVASDYELCEDIDQADVVVVNSCAFIQSATEESIEVILEAARDWLPNAKNRHILVAGCMPSRYGDELEGAFQEVSAFLSVVDEHTICGTIERLTGVASNASNNPVAPLATAAYAYIKIADGCNKSCAYCTIPSIRGPYKSKPLQDIIDEVNGLAQQGVSEFILIAQDTTEYGSDLSEDVTIIDVIDAVCALDSVKRVRLMYLQPDGVRSELIQAIKRQPKVCHYIEMPLQHASRSVLRSMNRRGDGDEFKDLIAAIRSELPDVVLRTTVIVGYPGETDEDFAQLCSFIEEVEFDYVGIFPYSREEGTSSADLPDQIDEDLKLERYQTLRDIADSIGWSKASLLIGQEVEVLVEGTDDTDVYGRTRGQAPDIDGIVRLYSNGVNDVTIGSYVQAKITDAILYDLDGQI